MSMVENPYPLGGDFAEAWGEGAAAERERIVKLLRDDATRYPDGEAAQFADLVERSAPSPSPPEPAPDVDAIIERLRERRTFINPGRPPLVPLDAAVAAVREAVAAARAEIVTQAERAERLAAACRQKDAALVKLAKIHHATLGPSKLHDPERRDWTECPCFSCADALAAVKNVAAVERSGGGERD